MNLRFSQSTLPPVKAQVARYIQDHIYNTDLGVRIVLNTRQPLTDEFLQKLIIGNGRATAAYDIQEKLLYTERIIQNPKSTDADFQYEVDNAARYFDSELDILTRNPGFTEGNHEANRVAHYFNAELLRLAQNAEFAEPELKQEAAMAAHYFNSELIRLSRVNGNLYSAGVYMDVISYLS